MADDGICRDWAQRQIGGTSPSQTANENLAAGAVVGTMVGAGLGALIGAATGNAGAGAAIGAGAGLLGGTSIGANEGAASEYQLQRRYDIAYQQCMYSGKPDSWCTAAGAGLRTPFTSAPKKSGATDGQPKVGRTDVRLPPPRSK